MARGELWVVLSPSVFDDGLKALMFNSPETLISLAEVAIAIAGFASIVLVVKSTSSQKWLKQDTDFFTGMAFHTMFAVFFCFLSALVNIFIQDPVSTLRITCAISGTQLVLHGGLVIFLPSTKGLLKIFRSWAACSGRYNFSASQIGARSEKLNSISRESFSMSYKPAPYSYY